MTSKINFITNQYNIGDDIINNIKDLLYGTIVENKKKYKQIMKSINEYSVIQLFFNKFILEINEIKEFKSFKIIIKQINKKKGDNLIYLDLKWESGYNAPTSIIISDCECMHIETYEYILTIVNDEFIAEFMDLIIYSNLYSLIRDIKESN